MVIKSINDINYNDIEDKYLYNIIISSEYITMLKSRNYIAIQIFCGELIHIPCAIIESINTDKFLLENNINKEYLCKIQQEKIHMNDICKHIARFGSYSLSEDDIKFYNYYIEQERGKRNQ